MPTIIDYVIYYLRSLLPSFILASLVVLIGLLVYYFGKKTNLTLMDESIKHFERESSDWVTKIDLVEKSTVGRTYLVEVEDDYFLSNFRLHFTMVHRHLILSRIGSILRNRRDYVLLEADPKIEFVKRYQLEILQQKDTKRIKALSGMLLNLHTLELKNPSFDKHYKTWANAPRLFFGLLKEKKNIVKNLYTYRDYIVRVSIYPLSSPSIRLVAELNSKLNFKHLSQIISDITTGIITLGKKGIYAKERESLRVSRDKDVEKDKGKRYSF
ncbi:MAG: hypothetical protein ACFE9L_07655 [Candidatus Hodarchaeota archaeon]